MKKLFLGLLFVALSWGQITTIPGGGGGVTLDSTQTLTNKKIDGVDAGSGTTRSGANNIQIASHNTDCTSLTDGTARELCFEEDEDRLFICEPSSGDCDTAAEWKPFISHSIISSQLPTPLSRWNPDASTITDSGSEASGACTLSVITLTDTGGGNYAADFNGTTSRATCGTGLDELPTFTLTAWIKPDNFGEVGVGRIITKGNTGSTSYSWGILIEDATDCLTTAVRNSADSSRLIRSKDTVFAPDGNTWYFVATAFRCPGVTECATRMFVDGVEIIETGATGSTGARKLDGADSILLGQLGDGTSTFDGLIDDWRVYGADLTAGQIATIYAAGRP